MNTYISGELKQIFVHYFSFSQRAVSLYDYYLHVSSIYSAVILISQYFSVQLKILNVAQVNSHRTNSKEMLFIRMQYASLIANSKKEQQNFMRKLFLKHLWSHYTNIKETCVVKTFFFFFPLGILNDLCWFNISIVWADFSRCHNRDKVLTLKDRGKLLLSLCFFV